MFFACIYNKMIKMFQEFPRFSIWVKISVFTFRFCWNLKGCSYMKANDPKIRPKNVCAISVNLQETS